MLKEKKAVIFDMDGSLVDSMWMWPEVDREYMKKHKITPPETFHKDIEGMSYVQTAQYFLDQFPVLDCAVEDICREWTEMTRELYRTRVPLKPGAGEFLERMKRRGILMGIATSNSQELAFTALDALHIRDYFSAVITSDEVQNGKPAPDVYLKAAMEMEVLPRECLVFEDIPNGIRAGKSAGMSVCAVDDLFSAPCEAEKRKLSDYYIRDYREIWDGTYEICRRAERV